MRALKKVRRQLKDPSKNLRNWTKTDPCAPTKEWNGVICTKEQDDDAYFHVQELYVIFNCILLYFTESYYAFINF